ncbi:hypothetical protein Daesc_001376 [Daldinia eschscholtzii]|uniref:Heterokaryon incompatibility domain-containing protein n=1 Tax=Daldinia eschscholtzii TaxID=292717 RepID=A0AAX6MUA9_9PEZI
MDPLASINPYASLKEGLELGQVYQKLPNESARFLRYKGIEKSTTTSEQILVLDLEIHRVQDVKSQYSTLSYAWGHPILEDFEDDYPHIIICGGQRMPIGLNLNHALQHVYLESDIAPPLFWVDALCINQSDLAERTEQVALMTTIYRNASSVVAWLGKDDEDAHKAHALLSEYTPVLEDIESQLISPNPEYKVRPWEVVNLYDDEELHKRYHLTPKTRESWEALVRFLARRWFGRIWVVQEMVFNPSHLICCGPLRFSWHELDSFVRRVFGSQWYGVSLNGLELEMKRIARIFRFHREIRLSQGEELSNDPSFSRLSPEMKLYNITQTYLLSSSSLRATDPRDKVFALSAFVNSYATRRGVKPAWVEADYSLQTEAVMLATTMLLLWSTRSLVVFSYVLDLSCRGQSDLASWVPPFHICGGVASAGSLLDLHQGTKYHASSLSSTEPTFPDLHINWADFGLELQGYLLDTVAEVVEIEMDFLPILELCLRLPRIYINGQTPIDVLWRTLAAGRTDTEFPAPEETAKDFANVIKISLVMIAMEALVAGKTELRERISTVLRDIDMTCPHPSIPKVVEFGDMFNKILGDPNGTRTLIDLQFECAYRTIMEPATGGLKRKVLFRSHRGFLGLAPYSTRLGDEVWLLKGGNLFYVLRGDDGASAKKILLGEGYVHGFMEGEALKLDGMSYTSVILK